MKKYERLRVGFLKETGEVKGRRLTEKQVAKVIDLLARNGGIFEAAIVDMNVQSAEELQKQISILRDNHTNRMSPLGLQKNKEMIERALANFDSMSQQLQVQFILLTQILHRALQHATAYHSLRVPKELGKIEWFIDAKSNKDVTKAEAWWSETVAPFLASKSISAPAMTIPCGDYSYYDNAYGGEGEDANLGHDLSKVFAEITFSGDINYGLELVDILTNSLRRALVGNLQKSGWANLPELVIRTREESFQIVVIADQPVRKSASYADVYRQICYGRKQMLNRRANQWIEEEAAKEIVTSNVG